MTEWQKIDTAPANVIVLLYCPARHITNKERIEVGVAWSDRKNAGWWHSWATHWAPLPAGPDPAEVKAILDEEEERDHREREMEHFYRDDQL